jgi:hypothetical protein
MTTVIILTEILDFCLVHIKKMFIQETSLPAAVPHVVIVRQINIEH